MCVDNLMAYAIYWTIIYSQWNIAIRISHSSSIAEYHFSIAKPILVLYIQISITIATLDCDYH